jgi:coenzyme F420 hydrogenase subunit beta
VVEHPLQTIVRQRQCMGCGMCTLIQPSARGGTAPRVRMEYDAAHDQFAPAMEGWKDGDDPGRFVCPGADMDMPALAQQVHGHEPADALLGEVVALRAAHAADPDMRRAAASGGVVPALLARLFETGAIDFAYTVRGDRAPREAGGMVIHDASELSAIHGSVYHPANFGAGLHDLLVGNGRFAFVGLPCEIAGLEMLKRQHPELAARHVMSIGLFCGGINAFAGIGYYLKVFGVDFGHVARIDYRDGDWPGRIKAVMPDGASHSIARIRGNSRWNILKYVIAFQGYWMLPRCRLCPDQVSDFADIAVGDPHLPRFRRDAADGISVAVSRTARGEALMRDAITAGCIGEQPISRDEVIESQGYTLDNRRHVAAYVKVARRLGLVPPRIRVYRALEGQERARHFRYAWVDLVKLVAPKNRLVRALYLPWQIFEYLFVTLTPRLVARRAARLIRNKGG